MKTASLQGGPIGIHHNDWSDTFHVQVKTFFGKTLDKCFIINETELIDAIATSCVHDDAETNLVMTATIDDEGSMANFIKTKFGRFIYTWNPEKRYEDMIILPTKTLKILNIF